MDEEQKQRDPIFIEALREYNGTTCKSPEEIFKIFTEFAITDEYRHKKLQKSYKDKNPDMPLPPDYHNSFNLFSYLADMALEIALLKSFLREHLDEHESVEESVDK